MARSIFVADDDRTAKAYGGDDANSPYRFYMKQLLTKLARFKRFAAFKSRPDMPDADITLDYVVDNLVIRGTVNQVVEKILAMHETIGDFGTLLYCGKDWTDPALEPPLHGIDGREGDAGRQRRDPPSGGGGIAFNEWCRRWPRTRFSSPSLEGAPLSAHSRASGNPGTKSLPRIVALGSRFRLR